MYIPTNIQLKQYFNILKCEGPLGINYIKVYNSFNCVIKNNILKIDLIEKESKNIVSNWGLLRINILKMIIGLSQGYYISLKCNGVGYKINIDFIKQLLILKVGFSHLIYIKIPKNIYVCCLKNRILYIYGSNYQEITQFASIIRKHKQPDSYKGKGLVYLKESLTLKEGKKTKY